MEAELQARVTFYLTGTRASGHLDGIEGLGLRPALFSAYRDLTQLRYDFPAVLPAEPMDGSGAVPMSRLVDGVLEKIADGKDADRIRHHVLRLEHDIRARVASGVVGTLGATWDMAAQALGKDDKEFADSLSRVRAHLKVDGELLDCDERTPSVLLSHAWGVTQRRRARVFTRTINQLVLKLSDILKADFVNSAAAKTAAKLQSAFGSGPMDHFDFDAMSRLLSRSAPGSHMTDSRRQRMQGLLDVLQSQQFFAASPGMADTAYSFTFDTCAGALQAYRERLPGAIELARAVAIAELEVKGEYSEARHGPIFQTLGVNGLDAKDLALFPGYLVLLNTARMSAADHTQVYEILSADLPVKILVQTDDVIEPSPFDQGHLAFALHSRRLASMALGLNSVFVLQSPSSNLLRLVPQIQRGLDFPGPALYSIFSGASGKEAGLPAYLVAAAALQSRVFPAFVHDPSAGMDWASRLSLADNPQPELDWPLEDFVYQDARCQSVSQQLAFTMIDFVLGDPRYQRHFARVPQEQWDDTLAPAEDTVAGEDTKRMQQVPSLLAVDAQNRLQKVVVDETLVREARRCRAMWHSLQELGGIHNSHAQRLLAREKMAWEQAAQAVRGSPVVVAPTPLQAASAATSPLVAAVVAEPEAERSPDEAYIETARCSTCNECTQINNKMFAYDANQQAYIADLKAGTYAQLVEAAESCQVSVIHPGRPRNLQEPGLEDLLKRAEAFA